MKKDKKITVRAYGKLNLMLDIVGRREDGYHELETVMQSVDIYDTLELWVNGTGENKIICDKPDFPCGETNLIWKAIDAFSKYTGIDTTGITVRVDKQLPSMAGMAGGSADCAATLCALDAMFETNLTKKQLCEIGVTLGADVPFCIMGGTRMCKGVGEKMQALKSPQCVFVIVKPDVSISTPMAFRTYDSLERVEKCRTEKFLKSLENGDLRGMCGEMFNALEFASGKKEIELAKKMLLDSGAIGSLMTGSGSAVFGVFENIKSAEESARLLKDHYPQVWVCPPADTGHKLIV